MIKYSMIDIIDIGVKYFNTVKIIKFIIGIDIPNKFLKNKKVPILAWTITSKEIEKETLTKANNVIFQDYIPDSTTNY